MRKADTFARQTRRAVVAIIGWEKLGIEPSNPQISIGSETDPGWQRLTRGSVCSSDCTGWPAFELAE